MGRRGGAPLALLWIIAAAGATGCAYRPQARVSGWIEVETEHVRLRTSMSRSRAAALAREMQEMRDALAGSLLRCGPSRDADLFTVIVLSPAEFEEIAPEGVGGFYYRASASWLPEYEGQIVIPADPGRDGWQVYQHELTHHLVRWCLPRAPSWLNEGLAKLLETATVEDGKMAVGIPPFALVRSREPPVEGHFRGIRVVRLPIDVLPPIQKVLGMSSLVEEGVHGGLHSAGNYATAWALVHLLELGAADLHGRFQAYLGELTRYDADAAALFARHFGDAALQDRLDAYLGAGSFAYVVLRVAPVRRAPPRVRAMSESEAHLMWAWLWFEADQDDGTARARQHLEEAGADPRARLRAQLVAALARLEKEDAAGAERAVDSGLKGAPGDPALLQAKIELLLDRQADASAPAERLRPLARTAGQLCAVGRADLAAGNARRALALGLRGLVASRRALSCLRLVELARKAMPAS
jgi:hypothetical protein